jgi:hypothetical protein
MRQEGILKDQENFYEEYQHYKIQGNYFFLKFIKTNIFIKNRIEQNLSQKNDQK